MSGHGHEHGNAEPHAGHVDHHETSSDDFPADEPHSPAWLPLLGGALFLAGIFAFVVLGPSGKTAEQLASDAAAATPSANAAAEPAAPMPPPAQRPTPALMPGAAFPANHPQIPPPPGH